MIRKEILEDFVLGNILKILQNKKYMSSIIENLLKVQQQENLNSLLSSLSKEKKQAETTLNNVMKAVEQGIINNTTNKRMKELEMQIEELDRQILIQKSKNSFKIAKEDIEEYYLQAFELEPKLLIDYLIKEIRLYDDKIEITFNSPKKISPDNNQGFFIAEYSSKMRQIIQNKTIPNYIDIKVKIYV